MMENDWKKRLGMVYSTNKDYQFEYSEDEEPDTPDPDKQLLYVSLDKKNRKGKAVTLVSGFTGRTEDLKSLEKELKSQCGVGGSAKNNEIILQGDHRQKVIKILQEKGYRVKSKGG